MSILLIDDEEDVRNSLKQVLESAGYSVIATSSATEGLKFLLGKNSVRLILVDYAMPEMTGEEFLRHAWKNEQQPPALVITGIAPWRNLGLLELGVGYVRKPVNTNLLLGIVETYVRKKEAPNGSEITCGSDYTPVNGGPFGP